MISQTAFADCASVGMMGGCVPGGGMVEVPSHMKSQIVNRVTTQKTNAAAQAKTASHQTSKKSTNANITVASSIQSVQK